MIDECVCLCVCVVHGMPLSKPCPCDPAAHSVGSHWASVSGRGGREGLLAGQRPL